MIPHEFTPKRSGDTWCGFVRGPYRHASFDNCVDFCWRPQNHKVHRVETTKPHEAGDTR